jgi:hypothetical protein
MGKARQLCIFRMEYERVPKMDAYTAFIAAYSVEEANAYLHRKVGQVRVFSQGMACRVDALDDNVKKDIYNSLVPVGKKEVNKASDMQPFPEDDESGLTPEEAEISREKKSFKRK